MILHSFKNDYSEGAHPSILAALSEDNEFQENGYGEDSFCKEAVRLIREKTKSPDAAIHFVSGGTQANLICLSSMLKPYESVIAVESGHIAVHEAGAIEATGHKINTVTSNDGKLHPDAVREVLDAHQDEHQVKPGALFISNSTEIGTVYSKAELTELANLCRKEKLYLYLDGARLGSALASSQNDVSLEELTRLVDMYYIGGTKNGALLGEAIVIQNDTLKKNFRFHLKQRGALLAKGRILGAQFREFFRNDLYFTLAAHANTMAEKLAEGIQYAGFSFLSKPVSNQIFPIFPDILIEKLLKKYGFYVWSRIDENNSSVRLVTSWATTEEKVNLFLADLREREVIS